MGQGKRQAARVEQGAMGTADLRSPDAERRHLLSHAWKTAAGVGLLSTGFEGFAAAPSAASAFIDQTCLVPAGRLDSLVASVFNGFNKPVLLPPFSPARHGARHDVALHRLVTDWVMPQTGERLKITGLLALPVGVKGPVPVVSWQHGTILSFGQVPSNLLKLKDPSYQVSDSEDSLETLFNVQRLAGQGYAVVAADYVGKGPLRNGRSEAYAVQDVTTQTCVRMLDIGRAAMRALNLKPGPIFLHGWSQGALNTQWLHPELRRRGHQVVATAVDSPFNDLSEAWRFWSGNQTFPLPEGVSSYPDLPDWISLCMIVALGSYEVNYKLTGLMKSAIRPEFYDVSLKFWNDYKLDFDPTKPFPTGRNLLVPGFFSRFTDERNSAFIRRMASNTTTYHLYDSPIRFYHGLADEAIHPVMAGRALAAGGAQAVGIPVAGASHRGTFMAALYGDASTLGGKENVVDWFNRLRG